MHMYHGYCGGNTACRTSPRTAGHFPAVADAYMRLRYTYKKIKELDLMKIVVVTAPKFLKGFLKAVFHIHD